MAQLVIYILMGIVSVPLILSLFIIAKEAFYKKRKETVKVYSNDEIVIKGLLKSYLSHY
jgi:hypothetical protein